jgi:acyl transferase domain-containing protein/NAD(P)-dependent dehydrogenase (short-subunit alcohol dehydrogenase family)/acyl carrier protein
MFNRTDDIAIVGIGCQFPGNITDLESFSKVIFDGVDAITEIPEDRWSISKFYAADHIAGKARTKWGGFIKNPYLFDYQYFNLTPREINSMDPQQRLLLEIFVEAIQDANIPEDKIKSTNTGVYIGAFTLDHMINELSQSNWEAINAHTSTGSMMTLLANRISYLFDLFGPSMVIDTACSSSLVAIHLAVEGIKNGDCDQAVAGGVNLMLNPGVYVAESKANMLSPTGRSRSFDVGADGYVRGEGAGLIVLKRLQDAILEKNYVYAVIKGSAINQDGRSSGQTVPNGVAQEKLIRLACQKAGISPAELQYVEAHGTGTPVGDPIEANAIGTVVSAGRSVDNPCYVGSVKTNFGHTEAAAGVAALIKVLACFEHEKISKLVHFKSKNPQINFDDLRVKLVTENIDWPRTTNKPRLAGINCFGFGGTNAHVVLSDLPEHLFEKEDNYQRDSGVNNTYYLPISANDDRSLYQATNNMFNMIKNGKHSLYSICSSAALFRSHAYKKRELFFGNTIDDIIAQMHLFLEQWSSNITNTGYISVHGVTRSTMVLSGMGPQWWGMGRGLLKEPVFKKTFNRCCTLFQLLTHEFSILQEFTTSTKDSSRMMETQIAQVANFILQVALADLYRSKGVVFDCIVGHSVGEIAAAYIAGALSLEDAMLVTFHRSRLQQMMSGSGTMLAVGVSYQQSKVFLNKCSNKVSVAAVNGPEAITLSGDTIELKKLAEIFTEKGIFNKFLKVDVPYHSPILEPLKEEFLKSVANIKPQKAHTMLFSTVTGQEIAGEALNSEYWWRNLRDPVYFLSAIENILQQGTDLFCEIGPHPVLSNSLSQILESKKQLVPIIYSLKRDIEQLEVFNTSLRQLFRYGYNINWHQIYQQGDCSLSLPKYPWQRNEYKNETVASQEWRLGNKKHELLGFRLFSPVPTWELNVNRHDLNYIFDHKVLEQEIFPAAAYIEMVIQATRDFFENISFSIKNLTIHRPIFLPVENESVYIQLVLDHHRNIFHIYSRTQSKGHWEHHAEGEIGLRAKYLHTADFSYNDLTNSKKYDVTKKDFYAYFEKLGFQYGPAFQLVDSCSMYQDIVQATLIFPVFDLQSSYCLHPTIMDSALQCLLFASKIPDIQYLPTKIEGIHIYGVLLEKANIYARIINQNEKKLHGEVFIYDQNHNLIVWVEQVVAESFDRGLVSAVNPSWFYEVTWSPNNKEFKKDPEIKQIMVFADEGNRSLYQNLSKMLADHAYEVILVYADNKTEIRENSASVLPGSEESMRLLFTRFSNVSVVAWLWSLNAIQYEENFGEKIDQCNLYGVHSLVPCLKAIDQFSPNTKLWLITRGMTNALQSNLNISQAHQLGFSRVMAYQEAVGRWCGYIDLAPEQSDNEVDYIFKEVTSLTSGMQDEIAYREGMRYVNKLRPLEAIWQKSNLQYSKDVSYLITGGLGELGFLVAKYLIHRGAQHIILQIRESLPNRETWGTKNTDPNIEQKILKIKSLEATGVIIHVTSVDITQSDKIREMSAAHRKNGFPPIKAVIHCAGTVQDRLVYNMEQKDIRQVFSPKINASWALHEAFLGQLEMFVLFSSYASIYGAKGQSNYAAANGFMDLLAAYRHQRNMNCISINFGPWADVGMAAKLNSDNYFARVGIQSINPENGWKIFDMLFNYHAHQVIVCPTDWSLIDKLYPLGHPTFLNDLLLDQAKNVVLENADQNNSESIEKRLLNAPDGHRNTLLQDFLKETLSSTTGILIHDIDMERRIVDYGVDSIISVEFKSKIEKALPLKLKLMDFLKGPTLVELSNILENELVN